MGRALHVFGRLLYVVAIFGVLLFLSISFTGCGLAKVQQVDVSSGQTGQTGTGPILLNFSNIMTDVLAPNCMNCHQGMTPAGANIDLSTYNAVLTQLTPGNPATSNFYNDIENGRMPIGTKLPSSIAQEVFNWIQNGAPNSPPQLSAIAPSTGTEAGGTIVTISGANLVSGATVTLGGVACTSVQVAGNGSSATCTTPASSKTGAVDLVWTNPDKNSTTLPQSFSFQTPVANAPTISSVAPPSALPNTATSIVITGTNFKSGAAVTVGGTSCTGITVTSATSLSCTAPAEAAQTPATIVVTNTDGGTANSTLFSVAVAATFTNVNSLVIGPSCRNCHGSSGGSGGVNLGSYAQVSTYVTANNTAASSFYTTCAGPNPPGGRYMPNLGNVPTLSTADLNLIANWINSGALNN